MLNEYFKHAAHSPFFSLQNKNKKLSNIKESVHFVGENDHQLMVLLK
jgi:hypothetical protein